MTHINFTGNAKKYLILSIAIIAAIVVATVMIGPQLDIQFKGGMIVTYAYEGALDIESFKYTVQDLTVQEVSFQQSTDIATGRQTVVVAMPGTQTLNTDQMQELNQGILAGFPENNITTLSSSNVDPTMGTEFLTKSIVAVAVASALIVVFVAFRFRRIGGFSAGVMAVIALMHDVIVVYGVFVVFHMPINDNFIAVVLTILGYSVNDTIVIYDRIRENKRLMGLKAPLSELVNTSINQSFRRSLNTTITTVLAMVVVTVVAYL